jgi:MarR family transcriptional regulator, organic hydroperoxide resistance regulator
MSFFYYFFKKSQLFFIKIICIVTISREIISDLSVRSMKVRKKQMAIADIFDNLRRVYQVINEQSKKAKKQTGITGPQLWAIKMIAESSPVQVSELARKMYLHPATVVGILNRLEEQSLVIRTRTREDRRVVDVNLTPEGKALVARAPEVAQGLLAAGLEVLPVLRLLEIASALDQLVQILGAQEVPPHLILSPEVNVPRKLKKS